MAKTSSNKPNNLVLGIVATFILIIGILLGIYITNNKTQISSTTNIDDVNWVAFNVNGTDMASGILEGFEYPTTWSFDVFTSGAGSFIVFSDFGGKTKEFFLQDGYRIDLVDQVISLDYRDSDLKNRESYVRKLDNVCGFSTGIFNDQYKEGVKTNTKTNVEDKKLCEEILSNLESQLNAFLNDSDL